jgi:hypothetical protein
VCLAQKCDGREDAGGMGGGIIDALDGSAVSLLVTFIIFAVLRWELGVAELCGLDFLIGWTCKLWVRARNTWFTRSASGHVFMRGVKGGIGVLVTVLFMLGILFNGF